MSRNPVKKLFGGLKMSWPAVIIFAVATAVICTLFLVVPFFANTSLIRMGEHLEAWILFAVIIMSNCKKPLESALKTFVFFLISQPLIYLFQVPFSDMGWGIFMYYRFWFIWTLATFPMAFLGWFITKRNWISLLILSPALVYLGSVVYTMGAQCINSFPSGLIACLFCIIQIILYILAFMPKIPQKVIGGLIPVAAIIAIILIRPVNTAEVSISEILPDNDVYSESAVISVEDTSVADVSGVNLESGFVRVDVYKEGKTRFTLTDGSTTKDYELEVFDENGEYRTMITSLD